MSKPQTFAKSQPLLLMSLRTFGRGSLHRMGMVAISVISILRPPRSKVNSDPRASHHRYSVRQTFPAQSADTPWLCKFQAGLVS